MTLRKVFQNAKRRALPRARLYLPADAAWTLDTDGLFLDGATEELDEDEFPVVAKQKNLRESLDYGSIEEVVDWADRLAGREDESARLNVFRYYSKFGAFPDRLGAPDPPPAAEIVLGFDRQFYDLLGAERPETKCRKEDCNRGTIKFSVFCRIHHFEKVRKKACPFRD